MLLRLFWALTLGLAAVFSFVAASSSVAGQEPADAAAAQDNGETEQRALLRQVQQTEQLLQESKWLEAAEQFEAAWELACAGSDPLLEERGADVRQLSAGQTDVVAGGRARLEQLYRSTAAEFKTEYARQFEAAAQQKLRPVLSTGNAIELRRLALRYQFTAAGRTGLKTLARLFADRGDFLEAAVVLERVRLSETDSVRLLLQTAWCYAMSGLRQDAADLSALARSERFTANLAADGVAGALLADIERLLTSPLVAGTPSVGWKQPLGNYRRTERQLITPPRLRSMQTSSLFEVTDVLFAEQLNPLLAALTDFLETQREKSLRLNSTSVPASGVLVAGELFYARTPVGLQARHLQTGELAWEVVRQDAPLRALISLQKSAEFNGDMLSGAVELYRQLIRTVTTSQMAISGRTLYVVEDSDYSQPPNTDMFGNPGSAGLQLRTNFIRAYDATTGLFLWQVGGQTQDANPLNRGEANLLAGYYFLGAPLVLGNRIYVLAENGEGIHLIRLGEPQPGQPEANPSILASQLLTLPERRVDQHPLRKHAGLIPSFAQGLLICPLCDDRIIAVSAEDLSIRWVFRYGGILQRQELGGDALILRGSFDPLSSEVVDLQNRWIDFLPRISDGKILVTPRDSDQLYCLNLADGQQLWTAPRGALHAIAGVADQRVVLIGNRTVSAIDLNTGRQLWNSELRHGVTCGTCCFDGTVLQIPTNAPSIVLVDTRTGRELVAVDWSGPDLPGNLLQSSAGLLSAGFTAITRMPFDNSEPLPSERAAEFLVQGRREDARNLLEAHLAQQPQDVAARTMLIDLLLQLLRTDYSSNQQVVGTIRELLVKASQDLELAPLLHSLLAMGPGDAVVLGEQLRLASRRQQLELAEIIAQGESFDPALPFPEFLERFRNRLRQLPGAGTTSAVVGNVERSTADVIAGALHRGLELRTARERSQIQQMVIADVSAIVASLSTEQQKLQFIQLLVRIGLPQTAAELLNDASLKWDAEKIRLPLDMALLESARQSGAIAQQSARRLLAGWQARQSAWPAYTWLQDLQAWQNEPGHAVGWSPSGRDEQQAIIELATNEFPALLQAPASPWQGTVTAQPSDDRTMLPVRQFASAIPHRAIPMHGNSGLYRGWRLMWVQPGDRIAAFDPDGRIRWSFQPLGTLPPRYYGYRPDSAAYSCGNVIVLCLPGLLVAVDGHTVNSDGSPPILWQKTAEPEYMVDSFVEPDPGDFIALEDRMESFAWSPGGHFPVGPASPRGIPVISGRKLSMLDLQTGQQIWANDGIPADARLLTIGSRLLILSESARRIETRSEVDGELLETCRLPDWWAEANANVGSSVEDIEVEPGSETIWRVDLQDHCCVLFRLTAGKAILESRNLLLDEVVWTMTFPQRTVFSNSQDGVVAVLSEGQRLLLIRTDTGRILTDLQVQPIPRPRQLYLQQTRGRWLVLPEARSEEDPAMDFFNPLIDAVHVHGAIYAIDDQTLQLAWQQPVNHRQVRGLTSTQTRPLMSTSPLLVLLSRNRVPKETGGFTVPVGAQVLDVATGRLVYDDPNTGLTQNELWLSPSPDKAQICLSFDRRIVIFQWDKQATQPAP